MSYATFEQLQAAVMELYQHQAYQEAYALMTRDAAAFPEEEAVALYLRSCLAARIEKPELALSLFEEALAKDYWYSEHVVRHSPSWAGLQGRADFERLAETSIEREREAVENAAPEMFVSVPTRAAQPYPTLIVLHGNGDNGTRALQAWQQLTSEGWLVAAFQSSQIAATRQFLWEDQERTFSDVQTLWAALQTEYEPDAERVVVAGFSMGGARALQLALTQRLPVQGAVLLGPAGAAMDDIEATLPAQIPQIKVYIIVGDNDQAVETASIGRVVTLLQQHNISTTVQGVTGLGHAYPADVALLSKAVQAVIQ